MPSTWHALTVLASYQFSFLSSVRPSDISFQKKAQIVIGIGWDFLAYIFHSAGVLNKVSRG
jgi:hypothetical protein